MLLQKIIDYLLNIYLHAACLPQLNLHSRNERGSICTVQRSAYLAKGRQTKRN